MRSCAASRSWTVLALMAFASIALAQTGNSDATKRQFLRKVIQLDDEKVAAMERGEVVTKQLPSPEKPEIAAFGAVRVHATLDKLREQIRAFQEFRKVPQIVQIGRFASPPRIEDIEGLTIEDNDLKALEACRPGKCDVKVAPAGLDRLKKEINWSLPDAKAKASALLKEQMLAYVKAYLAGGTDAMAVLVDKSQAKELSAEFRTLLGHSPYLVEYVAPFDAYLESYPRGHLAGAEDVIFWTKDTFGLKPVVSVYHGTVYKQEEPRPLLLIAIKTLYASHYFNAALELMAAVPAPNGSGIDLLDLYRVRIDPPTGMLSGVLMGKVKSGIEEGVAMNLRNAKARLEQK